METAVADSWAPPTGYSVVPQQPAWTPPAGYSVAEPKTAPITATPPTPTLADALTREKHEAATSGNFLELQQIDKLHPAKLYPGLVNKSTPQYEGQPMEPLTPDEQLQLYKAYRNFNVANRSAADAKNAATVIDPSVLKDDQKAKGAIGSMASEAVNALRQSPLARAPMEAFQHATGQGDWKDIEGQFDIQAQQSQAAHEAHPYAAPVGAGVGFMARPEVAATTVATGGVAGPLAQGAGVVGRVAIGAGAAGVGMGGIQTFDQAVAGEPVTPVKNFVVNAAGGAAGAVGGEIVGGVLSKAFVQANPGKAAAIKFISGMGTAGGVQAGMGAAQGQTATDQIIGNILAGASQHVAFGGAELVGELKAARETLAQAPPNPEVDAAIARISRYEAALGVRDDIQGAKAVAAYAPPEGYKIISTPESAGASNSAPPTPASPLTQEPSHETQVPVRETQGQVAQAQAPGVDGLPAPRANEKVLTPQGAGQERADSPSPPPTPTKEPWEMTLQEYNTAHVNDTVWIRGEPRPVTYIRMGDLPAGKPSTNHFTGKPEKGVSVYAAYYDPATKKYVLAGGNEQHIQTQSTMGDRPAYEVTGKAIVDVGADGESLLDHKTVSSKKSISLDDIVFEQDPWLAMSGKELEKTETPDLKNAPIEKTPLESHKEAVGTAIAEGRNVPPEVLADYPDLKQKPLPGTVGASKASTGEGAGKPTPEPPKAQAEVKNEAPRPAEPAVPQAAAPAAETVKTPQGPGAANPKGKGEFEAPDPTGIKHATVAKEREKLGMPPREKGMPRKDDDVIDAAVQRHLENSTLGHNLVEALTKRPRPLDLDETADLLVHQRAMLNERTRLEDAIVSADKNGEDAEGLRDQLSAVHKGLEDTFRVSELAGTEQGRAFRARRWMMNEGYTLGEMERSYKVAKGEDLNPEEKAKLVDLAEKIKSAEAQLKGVQKTLEENIRRRALEAETNKMRKDAATKAYRDSVAGKKQDWTALRDKLKEGMKDSPDNAESWIKEIFKSFVGEGLEKGESHLPENRDKYLDATHEEVQKILPDVTKQQVSDAITGYGDFKHLSKEEIDVQTRQYRGELRELAKLSDVVDKQQAPKKTGMERQTPSDEERQISKQLRERMKALGINTADPETQLKTALQSRKTYYENRIKDLKLEIAKRELTVKGKSPQPTDAELEAMKKEYATIKAEHESIFGKDKTDAERLAAAIKATERADAENQRRIKENDLFAPAAKKLSSVELDAAKAKAEASAATLEHLRDLARGQEFQTGTKAEAERIAQVQKQIDALNAKIASGEVGTKQGPPKPDSPAVAALKAQRTKLQGTIADTRTPPKTKEQIALQAKKTYLLNRAADLAEKIVTGDYAPAGPREGIKLDRGALILEGVVKRLKQQADAGKRKYDLARRSTGRKIFDTAVDIAGAHKAFFLAGDVSYVLNQGGKLIGTAPIKMFTAMKDLFHAGVSQKYADSVTAELENGPKAAEYKQAGLNFISDRRPSEQFVGKAVEKIPVLSHMERGQRAYINRLMAHIYDKITTPDMTLPEKKRQASFVNDLVQRTTFGRFDGIASMAAAAVISPRSIASQFKFLTRPLALAAPFHVEGLTPRVRLQQAKVYAGYIGALAAIYALGAATGAEIEKDPRSSSFGKMKWGNKTLDPLSGLTSEIVLGARLASGKTKDKHGVLVPNRGEDVKYGASTGKDLLESYAEGRANPWISLGLETLTGKNYDGTPLTAGSAAKNYAIPLGVQNIIDINKQDGVPENVTLSILSFLGSRVNTLAQKPHESLADRLRDKDPDAAAELAKLSPEDRKKVVDMSHHGSNDAYHFHKADHEYALAQLEAMTPEKRNAREVRAGEGMVSYTADLRVRLQTAMREAKTPADSARLRALMGRLNKL